VIPPGILRGFELLGIVKEIYLVFPAMVLLVCFG